MSEYLNEFGTLIPKRLAEAIVAENARLKAEVEELTHDANEADQQYEHAISRVRRLEAEVERLKGIILAQSSDFVRSKTADDGIKPDGHNDLAGRAVEHCLKLQIENERLRKAIHNFLSVNPNTSNPCGCGFWTCETKDLLELNNALEGKPSE